jgi:DNA modification methylase
MFAGVGSSGVAAKMIGRRSIMMEAGESNCEIAATRLQEAGKAEC